MRKDFEELWGLLRQISTQPEGPLLILGFLAAVGVLFFGFYTLYTALFALSR